MPVINSGVAYYIGDTPVQKLYAGAVQVWPPPVPVPTITSVSPTEYHHADGVVEMTINGTGFLPTSEVWLNGFRQNQLTYVSPTQVKANVDPANTGTADLSWPVIVRNPPNSDSNSVNITVVPEPTLASINPTSRLTTDPETTVTLTGTNFTPECKVTTDTGDMAGVVFVNRTTMTCKAGWNAAMTQNLKVVDERGHATVSKPFTVSVPPPTLPVVSSASGSQYVWGATTEGTITINGTGFVAPMTVEIDNSLCQTPVSAAATVVSPTQATCTCPGQNLIHNSSSSTDNFHNVRVTTPNGTSAWCDGQPVSIN